MPSAEAIAFVEIYLARVSPAAAAKKLKPRGRLPLVADRPAFYRAHRESGGRPDRQDLPRLDRRGSQAEAGQGVRHPTEERSV